MSRLAFRSSLTVVFILVVCCCSAFAQIRDGRSNVPFEIIGQVRYAVGGEPAHNVLVRLESLSGGSAGQITTDRQGKFRFTGLSPVQYIVSVRQPGFKEIQQEINLVYDFRAYVQFALKSDGSGPHASLGPATVLDVKTPLEAKRSYEKGRSLLLEEGRAAEAVPHLEKAITLYPNFPEAYLLLGTAHMDTKQWEKAERPLRRVIELKADSPAAFFGLGEVYRQQKRYADAEKALLSGLKLVERSWQGHYTLGRVYFDQGELGKAGRHVAKAIQLKPDLAEAHLLGGNILLRAGKTDDALMEFEEYLRLAPKGEFAAATRELVAKIKKTLAEKKK